jgi:hypothetical protein
MSAAGYSLETSLWGRKAGSIVVRGCGSTLRFAQHSVGAMSALRGQTTAPTSPLGDLGGKKGKKAIRHICGFRHIKGLSTEVSEFMSPFHSNYGGEPIKKRAIMTARNK